jgi:hypothetical protein
MKSKTKIGCNIFLKTSPKIWHVLKTSLRIKVLSMFNELF